MKLLSPARHTTSGLITLLLSACGALPPTDAGGDARGRPAQPVVDAAEPGAVIRLEAGLWEGPLTIDKPVTLDGAGRAVVTGNGKGSVIRIAAAGVTLRNLRIISSGSSHDAMDSAIRVTAHDAVIENVTTEDVLFSVFLEGSHRARVCGCTLTSKAEGHSLRGDAIRIWNGSDNHVFGNDIVNARDVSLANARNNSIRRNRIRGGRYGVQLVFAPANTIEENLISETLTGIAVLYSDTVRIRGNLIQHARGASGAGLIFKESGQALVEDNEVVHCAVGAKTNAPNSPESVISFTRNRFAHNIAGMDFYGENGGHLIHSNWFEKNLVQVSVSGPMSARGHDWKGNWWDDYEGFDRNGDGVGDTPYEIYAFADRIWQETPHAAFFRNAPALELLDFLERLAPFASPELTLSDARPSLRAPRKLSSRDQEFKPTCTELEEPL